MRSPRLAMQHTPCDVLFRRTHENLHRTNENLPLRDVRVLRTQETDLDKHPRSSPRLDTTHLTGSNTLAQRPTMGHPFLCSFPPFFLFPPFRPGTRKNCQFGQTFHAPGRLSETSLPNSTCITLDILQLNAYRMLIECNLLHPRGINLYFGGNFVVHEQQNVGIMARISNYIPNQW